MFYETMVVEHGMAQSDGTDGVSHATLNAGCFSSLHTRLLLVTIALS